MKIKMFNVGDGQRIKLGNRYHSNDIMIDCGSNEPGYKQGQLAYEAEDISGIENLIISHLHTDHYNGLLYALKKCGYFGLMVPPFSVKPCHFERCCNYTKNIYLFSKKPFLKDSPLRSIL